FVGTLVGQDSLTLGEKKAIARWYENYGYNDDMVQEAALQAGIKKDVWYLNGILKSWHAKGLRTIHEVRGGGAVQSPVSRNIRVDRDTPSGNDFLQGAAQRTRRLKRKD
ncbi:MAG: DnaD domain protein, partial [Faecalibacterium sp.]|nr:DnaD domain protein [Faecalibacterium sp.]